MEKPIPPGRLFGVLVARRLLNIWYDVLEYWAGRYVNRMVPSLTSELSSRGKFLVRNLELQEELRQVFAPFYHFCGPECSCCMLGKIPYNTMDSVLYGVSPDLVARAFPISLSEMLISTFWDYARVMQRYFKYSVLGQGEGQIPEQKVICPALTEIGCGLPWGQRPIFCVIYACGRFIRAMDRRAHWRFVWVICKYYLHITLSLKLLVDEWRHQQGMYSLKTEAGEA
jgi:hypothetical protein